MLAPSAEHLDVLRATMYALEVAETQSDKGVAVYVTGESEGDEVGSSVVVRRFKLARKFSLGIAASGERGAGSGKRQARHRYRHQPRPRRHLSGCGGLFPRSQHVPMACWTTPRMRANREHRGAGIERLCMYLEHVISRSMRAALTTPQSPG